MKTLILIFSLTLLVQFEAFSQSDFDLSPDQSMLMTGKGAGQDAAINPYTGEDCYVVVENIGSKEFSIRIQKDGEILQTVPISKKEEKKVTLPKGYELYLDSEAKAKARVNFEKMNR